MDGESGAICFDFDAEFFEIEHDVLDHVVSGGVADDSAAWEAGGGHEGVFGDGVAALDEGDSFVGVIDGFNSGFIEAAGGFGVDVETERLKGF